MLYVNIFISFCRVKVFLAEYDRRTFPKDCKHVLGHGQKCVENVVMYAEDAIPHPQYDNNRLYNDIALLRLQGMAPYTGELLPFYGLFHNKLFIFMDLTVFTS